MTTPEPEKPLWPSPFEAVLAIIAGVFIMGFIHSLFFAAIGIKDPSTELSSFQLKFFTITGGLAIGAVPLILARIRDYNVVELFRLNPLPQEMIIYGVIIGLSLAVIGDELSRIVELAFPVSEEIRQNLLRTVVVEDFAELLILFVGVVIVASVVEEALFRGFLQVSMEKQIDVTRAVVISSVAWAAMHLNPELPAIAVPLLVSGFISGYLAWRTNSIVMPVIIHGINNLLAIIYYNSDFEEILFFYSWQGHVSPLLLVPAIYALYVYLPQIDALYKATLRSSSGEGDGADSGE